MKQMYFRAALGLRSVTFAIWFPFCRVQWQIWVDWCETFLWATATNKQHNQVDTVSIHARRIIGSARVDRAVVNTEATMRLYTRSPYKFSQIDMIVLRGIVLGRWFGKKRIQIAASHVHKCRIAFWTRFAYSENDLENPIRLKHMLTMRLALAHT